MSLSFNAELRDNISPKLQKIQDEVKQTVDVFAKLRNAVAGLAIGNFIAQTVQMAAALDDIASSTGIALDAVVGFANGVQQFGGSMEAANGGLARFSGYLTEAVEGAKKNQDAFLELGITLNDLATLSERDLLRKTVQGLAGVNDGAKRTALQMQIFGKSFATVDVRSLNNNLDDFINKSGATAGAISAAAAAEEKFGIAIKTLQTSLLLAIQPITNFIAALDPQAINDFVKTVSNLVYTLGALFVAFKVIAPMAKLAETALTTGRSLGSVVAGTGAVSTAMTLLGGIMSSAKNGIYLLTTTFSSLGTVFSTNASLASKVGLVFTGLLGGFTRLIPGIGLVITGFTALNFAAEKLTGSSIKDWAERAAKALGLISQTTKEAAAENESELKRLQNRANALKVEQERIREVTDAMEKQRQAMVTLIASYKTSNEETIKKMNLDTSLIGLSEEAKQREEERYSASVKYQQELNKLKDEYNRITKSGSATEKETLPAILQAQKDLTSEYQQQLQRLDAATAARERKVRLDNAEQFAIRSQIDANRNLAAIQTEIAKVGLPELQQKIIDLTATQRAAADAAIAEEESRRKAKLSLEEQARYYQAAAVGANKLIDAQTQLNAKMEEMNLRNFAIKQTVDLNRQLRDITDQIAGQSLSELEKRYQQIDIAAREAAESELAALAARQGVSREQLDPQTVAAYYRAAAQGTDLLKQKVSELHQGTRAFNTGWRNAFRQYVDDATNAAKQAERLFQKFTSEIEDLFVTFAKTGKFEWKTFVANIAEELLRSNLRQLIAGIFGPMTEGLESGEGFLGTIGKLLGFGGGQAQRGNTASNPMFVYDISGGGVRPNASGMGGPTQGAGGGILGEIWDGVTGIFGSIGGAVSDIFSGIGDIFGGSGGGSFIDDIVSGVGSLFGGFFANGGYLPKGKFGIVGENGPEFISGPAQITPPMGGVTNVVYNINAVDASSFKQLVAADPSFIHAVAMQGGKGMARRY